MTLLLSSVNLRSQELDTKWLIYYVYNKDKEMTSILNNFFKLPNSPEITFTLIPVLSFFLDK